ncbi:unnamed protein product [Pipistrellus nathusii]|uniref:Apple domain-containing protein n=1 Tax=Pipistrellus nathusii TaxID=59473 RepID=A0ABP0AHV2_PIPNA
MDPAEAVLQENVLKFMNSSEREDCNNGEPPRKIIPEKNSLRQTYNSCARLCLNQETVCLASTAMKTENCVAKTKLANGISSMIVPKTMETLAIRRKRNCVSNILSSGQNPIKWNLKNILYPKWVITNMGT